MADEGLTEAQRSSVASHFIKSSPPAQLDLVEQDVLRIVPGAEDAKVLAAREASLLKGCVKVKVGDGESHVLVCEEGSVGDGMYVDSKTGQVVRVDFRASTAHVAKPKPIPAPPAPAEAEEGGEDGDADMESPAAPAVQEYEPLPDASGVLGGGEARAQVLAAVAEYAVAAFPGSGPTSPATRGLTGGVGWEVFGSADGSLSIVMSRESASLRNYWAGQWVTRFKVTGAGSGAAKLSGSAALHTHYYENGNVQMVGKKSWGEAGVPGGDLGAGVVKLIREWENEWQAGLSALVHTMSTDTLKEMRRHLPVSGVKMNWNVEEHRMRATLNAASGAGTR